MRSDLLLFFFFEAIFVLVEPQISLLPKTDLYPSSVSKIILSSPFLFFADNRTQGWLKKYWENWNIGWVNEKLKWKNASEVRSNKPMRSLIMSRPHRDAGNLQSFTRQLSPPMEKGGWSPDLISEVISFLILHSSYFWSTNAVVLAGTELSPASQGMQSVRNFWLLIGPAHPLSWRCL